MTVYNGTCFLVAHVVGALALVTGVVGVFSYPQVSAQVVTTDDANSNEIIANMENDTNNDTTTSGNLSMGSGRILDVSVVPHSSNLTDTAFQPNPVNIKVGNTVRWTNDDSAIHNVVEGNPATGDIPEGFESDLLNTGQTFEHTFNQTGTFDYYCDIHHNMVGQVIVT